jgi:hypothetical protein
MRGFAVLLLLLLSACVATPVAAPSLAPRAAEAIDPRVPVPEPALSAAPSPALVEKLRSLVAKAVAGDQAFSPLIENARLLAASAGVKESESWVVAQQALSAAVGARLPVTSAVGDIDALGAQRVQTLGGIGAADLEAINAAASKVAEIDAREAAAIDEVQRLLSR